MLRSQLKVAPTTLINKPATSSTTVLKQYKRMESEKPTPPPLSYSQVVKLRRRSHDLGSHLTQSQDQSHVQSHGNLGSHLPCDWAYDIACARSHKTLNRLGG